MQFEQLTADERVDLPKPSIDTGMGLERIAAVMQGTHDNYEIDMMQALIRASAEASKTDADSVSHRVIADHLRASTFLITDGVLPSNEGRGYVLRRIMRRAMRHAHMLGCTDPLMFRLVPALIREMGDAYPDLKRSEPLVTETLKLEETKFKQLLERGLKLLDDATGEMAAGDELDGEVAFKLYDTYGFPLDLTQDALKVREITVDEDTFKSAMQRQREEARKAWSGSGDAVTDAIWFGVRDKVGATDFLGYDTESAEGQIKAIVVDGKSVESVGAGAQVYLVLNQSPFYGESGGQMGDCGVIKTDDVTIIISDTQKRVDDVHVHIGVVESGTVNVGDEARLEVDNENRSRLRANHSATHLLHEALRRRLGDHVTQKGSLVAPDRLRFDVSHPKGVSADELANVEVDVNNQIAANASVSTRLMDPESAVEAGAMALFGEKYGDEVRVVSMGDDINADFFSTELCGGTHVKRTGDIGVFKILSETAVASGVRRIEALTGAGARAYFAETEKTLFEVASHLKANPSDVPARVKTLVEERRKLERELADARKKLAMGGGVSKSDDTNAVETVNGVAFLGRVLEGVPAKELKGVVDDLKTQMGSGVVAVLSVNDDKVSLVVGVTDDLTATNSAVGLVQAGSAAVGGKGGGGRPDMAQAGGPDTSKANEALDAIKAAINAVS